MKMEKESKKETRPAQKVVLRADEYGRMGGTKVLKKYGRKHFSELVKKRWDKQKKASA